MEQNNPTVSARVTHPLRKLMSKYLKNDAHISEGDFIRDAIREKIRRDTPELYQQMFKNQKKADPNHTHETRPAKTTRRGQGDGGSD